MAPRTSQLQIRISPEQKATLKRLAARAGLSVSAYVLAQSLPSTSRALEAAIADVRDEKPGALSVLRRQVEALPPDELGERLESVEMSDLTPLAQNQIAALVEEVAQAAGAETPRWTTSIPPLEHPYFRWQLRSLRFYQLRASPVALKRRNVFDPSGAADESARSGTAGLLVPASLRRLDHLLQILELDIEFYFFGQTLLHQAFPANPSSARPGAMLADDAPLLDALPALAQAEGWPGPWPEAALRDAIRHRAQPGQGYLDLPRLKAFTPPLGYALAMKAGAGGLERPGRAEDMRFLLRSLNLSTPDAAMTLITRYVAERHLPGETRAQLGRLLS